MTQVIMGWLYPMLASAYLVLAILLGLTWWVKDRLLVILLLAMMCLTNTASIGLLSIVTGTDPLLSIDMLRPWIVASRVVMLLVIIPCVVFQFRRLKE